MPNQKPVLSILHKTYPDLHHYLQFSNHLELLVATILSAQIRDSVVNAATPTLFKKYKTAKDYANAGINEIIGLLQGITYAGTKAKYIKETGKILHEKYNGHVPKTMEQLTELPGIGRKSANAILQNAFNIVEGIVVDTHVLRVSYRLGWTTTDKNAVKSEMELMQAIPKSEWKTLPWLMKNHGRAICKAPTPVCSKCVVNKFCPKQGVTKKL
ncbi:endonuclease III [Candidatus Woesearchaeota archaeon]|nr:endonuclease III [Candidatus Woesearchaeota archaeon]